MPCPSSIPNLRAALEHLGVELYFNDFTHKIYCTLLNEGRREFDNRLSLALYMKSNSLGLKVNLFFDTLQFIAVERCHHPVRNYLNKLSLDGVNLIDRWLADYANVEGNELDSAIGRKFLLSAVRRIRKPGVKFDQLLVLEGKQGAGKSTLVRTLASSDWFTDNLRVGEDSQTTIELTRGKWIVEISELSGIKKKDTE